MNSISNGWPIFVSNSGSVLGSPFIKKLLPLNRTFDLDIVPIKSYSLLALSARFVTSFAASVSKFISFKEQGRVTVLKVK